MVTPEWPPTTGTLVLAGRVPAKVERNEDDRTTSRVVTPNNLRAFSTSACKDMDAPLGVVDTVLLVDLSADGDGRVDGVGDDAEERLGRNLGGRGSEVTHDRSVGLRGISTFSTLPKRGGCRTCDLAGEALRTLNKSSRVIPGFRGTPAGMMMMEASLRQCSRPLFSAE